MIPYSVWDCGFSKHLPEWGFQPLEGPTASERRWMRENGIDSAIDDISKDPPS